MRNDRPVLRWLALIAGAVCLVLGALVVFDWYLIRGSALLALSLLLFLTAAKIKDNR